MTDPSVPTTEEGRALYMEYTLRAMQRQATVLSELRTRANILLSASGVVAGLVGPEAIKHPHPQGLLWLALAVLTIAVVCCIAVIWPVSNDGEHPAWGVTLSQNQIAEITASVPDSGEISVSEELVCELYRMRESNRVTLDTRTDLFNAACVFLPIQVAAWFAVLYF